MTLVYDRSCALSLFYVVRGIAGARRLVGTITRYLLPGRSQVGIRFLVGIAGRLEGTTKRHCTWCGRPQAPEIDVCGCAYCCGWRLAVRRVGELLA